MKASAVAGKTQEVLPCAREKTLLQGREETQISGCVTIGAELEQKRAVIVAQKKERHGHRGGTLQRNTDLVKREPARTLEEAKDKANTGGRSLAERSLAGPARGRGAPE